MRKRKSFCTLCAWLALGSANIVRPQQLSTLKLNESLLGDLAVIGDFDAISTYSYTGQETILQNPNDEDEVILQTGPLVFTRSSFTDGKVIDYCDFGNSSVAITGNFTNVGSVDNTSYAAVINLESGSTTALPGLPHEGSTIWSNSSELWVGGRFGTRRWNGEKWVEPVEFGGFSEGTVINAITPWQGNIVFGGSITGLRKAINDSKLDPGTQEVSFAMSQARGYTEKGATPDDASAIFCQSGWSSGLDSTTGYIDVSLGYEVFPTKIKLSNSDGDDSTKTWRLSSNGGILNLTYTDEEGNVGSCDAFCSLQKGESKFYKLVNNVPLTNFTLELLDFYGSHASIQGVELYHEGIVTYANNTFDLPRSCQKTMKAKQDKPAALIGDWQSQGDFMFANLTEKNQLSGDNTLARFFPTVSTQGNYEIRLFTPGCQQDGTCSQRGPVNVTVVPGLGLSNSTTTLYQTNNLLKYDLVYNGTLRDGAYVDLRPAGDFPLPRQFIAYRIELMLTGNISTASGPLFEYAPNNWTLASANQSYNPIGGPINSISHSLGDDANVTGIVNVNNSLVIAGANFTNYSPIFSMDSNEAVHQVSNISATKLQSIDDVIAISTSNGTYRMLLGEDPEKVGPGSGGVVPLSLNGTTFWAINADDGLKVVSMTDSTPNLTVKGHLSACIPLNGSTNFYFGSLQVADSSATDLSLIRNGTPVSSNVEGSKHLSKRDVSPAINFQYTSAVYLNDSTAVVIGDFNGTSTMVLKNGDQRPISEASNTHFEVLAASKDLAILGGSEFALFNATEDKFSSPQQPGGRVQALAPKPNSSEVAVGGQFGLKFFNISDQSWFSKIKTSVSGNVSQVQWTGDGSVLVGGNFSIDEKLAYLALANSTGSQIIARSQDLRGPVSSVISTGDSTYIVSGMDSKDSSKNFASWYSNGIWSDIDLPFSGTITSMALMPIGSDNNPSSSPLNNDRVLAFNGALSLNSANVSSIVWDGASDWKPFILTADTSRTSGFIKQFSSQKGFSLDGSPTKIREENPSTTSSQPSSSGTSSTPSPSSQPGEHRKMMSVGHVVGVSCAIAIGCLCLFVILYLLLAYIVELKERDHEGNMRVAYQSLYKAAPPDSMVGAEPKQ